MKRLLLSKMIARWARPCTSGCCVSHTMCLVETKQRALKKLDDGLWDLVILDIGYPTDRA